MKSHDKYYGERRICKEKKDGKDHQSGNGILTSVPDMPIFAESLHISVKTGQTMSGKTQNNIEGDVRK